MLSGLTGRLSPAAGGPFWFQEMRCPSHPVLYPRALASSGAQTGLGFGPDMEYATPLLCSSCQPAHPGLRLSAAFAVTSAPFHFT